MRALLLSSLWLVACSSTVSASDGGAADVGVPDVSTVPVGSVLHIAAAGPKFFGLESFTGLPVDAGATAMSFPPRAEPESLCP